MTPTSPGDALPTGQPAQPTQPKQEQEQRHEPKQEPTLTTYRVLVIGGGNAGLSVSGHLQRAGVEGVTVLNDSFFNEFTVKLKKPAAEVVEVLAAKGILAGVPVSRLLPKAGLEDLLIIASTEVNTDEDRAALVAALVEVL